MTGKFKYTEAELERVSLQIYRLMTARAAAILDLWPAFKSAQSTINPMQKYSTNQPSPRLMKELKRRVNVLFAEMSKKPAEPEVVIKDEALAKADAILSKLGIGGGPRTIWPFPLPKKEAKLTTALLTGNTVENATEERVITIVTKCPKKFVIVDLETGEQWSTNGFPNAAIGMRQTNKEKATRRLVIPKPAKGAK